jgi:ubiquinol-cytochrome c reductase cytochrome b subunit
MLGDASAELRGNGTRFRFQQEFPGHRGYLLWLHSFFADRGYCNPAILTPLFRASVSGGIRSYMAFRTWTFSSFNWIYYGFYPNGIKCVPLWIGDYLTPLALAVWIMDDGAAVSSGLKFCTNSFTHSECKFLANLLHSKFGLNVSVISAGFTDQYNLYVSKDSMSLLAELVGPYMHPSMVYK